MIPRRHGGTTSPPLDQVAIWLAPHTTAAAVRGLDDVPAGELALVRTLRGARVPPRRPARGGRGDRAFLRGRRGHVGLRRPGQGVEEHWPTDAVEVAVDGDRRWLLAADLDRLGAGPARTTRLPGPFDPYLQTRDRALPVPEEARAKDLWRTLGRPGAVLVGEVAGTWRPRRAGRRLTVQVGPWREVTTAALGAEAGRLAAVRGTELAGLALGG